MCYICTEPIESLIELTELYCPGCPNLVSIPPELVNLTTLHCFGCPLLASIPPTLTKLTRLYCSDCPRLVSIPSTLVSLTTLFCSNCPLLSSIPATPIKLIRLYCTDCRLLISIPPMRDNIVYQRFSGCPWLPRNEAAYPKHIPSLIRLQRWFRHGKKQVFKRVIRTRAFNEFVFHPDRIGGKLVKRQMEAELSSMRPAKQQRVE